MSPFREIEHTADWALEVWAPTLEALFVDAARGMFHLVGAVPEAKAKPAAPQPIVLSAGDYEGLLVAWLQELLYLGESEALSFDDLEITALTPTRLAAVARGRPVARWGRDIKAVTYHHLAIRQAEGHYRVSIVFDV